eukprot:gnl/Chilomastix_cuspidata/2061.p1 GENE.gnl/Chilomastix_cuspidata/2061~~gnl/Chilomastix_cuspidata/2061.p1  ORF type:complete len:929 (-),score=283.12 gnl/Chilomastix_cuspidata/2061:316-3102(-)
MKHADEKESFSFRYTRFLLKAKWVVLGIWTVLVLFFAYFAFLYLTTTEMQFDPPKNSEAAHAHDKMAEYFPAVEYSATTIVYVETTDGSSLYNYNQTMEDFTAELSARMLEEVVGVESAVGFFSVDTVLPPSSNLAALLDFMFISESESATFIVLAVDSSTDGYNTEDFVSGVEDTVDAASAAVLEEAYPGRFFCSAIGLDVILETCTEVTESDLALMDITTIPVAFIIFAFFLKSGRMIIIPLLNLIVVFVVSFGISYFAMYSFKVAPFTPSIQSSAAMALTVDYSLFILSNFRKAIHRGQPVVASVRYTISSAGKVVLISGIAVALTFASIAIYQVDLIRTTGIGAFFTVLVLVISSETLIPSLLVAFPNFFSVFFFNKGRRVPHFNERCDVSEIDAKHSVASRSSRASSAPLDTTTFTPSESESEKELIRTTACGCFPIKLKSLDPPSPNEQLHAQRASCLARTAHGITRRMWGLVVVLGTLVVCVPFIYFLTTIEVTEDLNQILPYKSDVVTAANDFASEFCPGWAFPSYIIFSPSGDLPAPEVFSEEYFSLIQDLGADVDTMLVEKGLLEGGSYLSPAHIPYVDIEANFGATEISWDFVSDCADGGFASLTCALYRGIVSSTVSEDATSALIDLFTEVSIDATGQDVLVDTIRAVIHAYGPRLTSLGLEAQVWGLFSDMEDAIDNTYAMFPWVTVTALVVLMVVMGFAFSSVFASIRLLFTVVIMLCYVLGSGVMIFQYGVDRSDGLYWAIPPFIVAISIGLSCDYDSFFYSVFRDYRRMGFTNVGAARKALYEAGHTINAAGVIMAVSFAGLLMSKLLMLVESGAMLVIDVLLDTFWIRTFLVPALVAILRKLNHWPLEKRLAPEQFDEFHFVPTDFGKPIYADEFLSEGKLKRFITEKKKKRYDFVPSAASSIELQASFAN